MFCFNWLIGRLSLPTIWLLYPNFIRLHSFVDLKGIPIIPSLVLLQNNYYSIMSVVVNRLLICMIWALLVSPVFSFMIPGLGFGMKRRAHSSSSLMISSTGSDNNDQSSCKLFLACVLEIHVYEIHSYDFLLYIHIIIFPIFIYNL